MNAKVFVLLILFVKTECCGDFYWRDYDNTIPADAIPAGNSINGTTFVGQAYIHNHGLYMGSIIPGQREIHVPCYGVKKTSVIIKILCAQDKRKYYWLPTTRDNYANDVKNKCPVIGGYDQLVPDRIKDKILGTLHVGKIFLDGNTIVGNVADYDENFPWFYYPLSDQEIRSSEFEVLMYNDVPVNFFNQI